jgi:hypothetical protein
MPGLGSIVGTLWAFSHAYEVEVWMLRGRSKPGNDGLDLSILLQAVLA